MNLAPQISAEGHHMIAMQKLWSRSAGGDKNPGNLVHSPLPLSGSPFLPAKDL
jgi:hypothetical protein